ncbi:ATP-dependent RNA helicase DBP2-like [Mercurialis annua]|uniref:ATP-dependent RNA helicase DBP2-like n=1 Tax=Mercurialis annua TaxID=3986 RepID=UPI00215F084F|nr:ATP-dependent RNA helicase DBP2-like [Mercurialis annua]XP_050217413.1 ATP-dependent RNA helicase DBP2-like [Mercurialis annua]
MSYVPPHLRDSSITTTIALPSSSLTLANDHSLTHSLSTASRHAASAALFSSPRTLSLPDVVSPPWNPSERVLRFTSQQIEDIRARLNVKVTVAPGSSIAPAPIESFEDMCLNESIMKDIVYHGYTRPTSIQAQAMTVALSGRDLLGCAETGSGKTAAFTIPMIQHCLAQPPVQRGDGPLALVLAPTRELAQQIEKEVKCFSRSLDSFRSAIVVGGTNISDQRSELRGGVDIVVATPGRLIDHLQQGNTSLSRISFIVLDEADRMLDMGFEPQIREVLHNLPKRHQTLLFSATMPEEIETLAQDYLTNPVQVMVGKLSGPTSNVLQSLVKVTESEKIDRLLDLLVKDASQAERSGLTVVFVERKARCDEVTEALVAQGLRAVALHGGRSQNEREAALHDFRSGSTNILVATDVASRGLDVTGVTHVINLDLPKTMEDYIHRVGRTGRAGSAGQATSFYTDRDMFLVAQINKARAAIESGDNSAFATGKTARRKEREAATTQKETRNGVSKIVTPASINIEDKYRFMISSSSVKGIGAADSAWDD